MPGVNVNPFATEEQWAAAGSPGGNYAEWLKSIGYDASGNPVGSSTPPAESLYNPDGSSKNGKVAAPKRNPTGSTSPQTWEERLAAGEFEGNEAGATELEVRRRRQLLTDNHDMKDLPPDVADILQRDYGGKVRKARQSTTQSALGAAFDSKSSLFGDR